MLREDAVPVARALALNADGDPARFAAYGLPVIGAAWDEPRHVQRKAGLADDAA